jgi:hypothetical protein
VTESGLSHGAEVFGSGTGAWDDRVNGMVLRRPMHLRPGNEEAARGEAGFFAGGGVAMGAAALVGGPFVGPSPVPLLAAVSFVTVVLVLGTTFALRVYNRVVRATTQRDKAAAMIEVELEHRASLVPQLLDVVRCGVRPRAGTAGHAHGDPHGCH